MVKPAKIVERTSNTKVGRMAVTYAPISRTCPAACPLRKDSTCYVLSGRIGVSGWYRDMEDAAEGKRAEAIARAEAAEIDAAFGGGPIPWLDGAPRILRLHVSGDARTATCARILSAAALRWKKRGGGPVYTYTHAWRSVPREAWGHVSVLASIDDASEASEARARGYVPALVVGSHASANRVELWTETGSDVGVPCPNQTRGITCAECRLCFKASEDAATGERGWTMPVVLFAAHGTRAGKLRRRLEVVS